MSADLGGLSPRLRLAGGSGVGPHLFQRTSVLEVLWSPDCPQETDLILSGDDRNKHPSESDGRPAAPDAREREFSWKRCKQVDGAVIPGAHPALPEDLVDPVRLWLQADASEAPDGPAHVVGSGIHG